MRARSPQTKQNGLIGIGLDAQDGQTRITRGEGFVLAGGSSDTHSRMQETAIKLTERLADQGHKLPTAPKQMVIDTLGELLS